MRRITLLCCLIVSACVLSSCGNRAGSAKPSSAELKLCASVGIDAATCSIIKGEAGATLVPLHRMDAEGYEHQTIGVQFVVPYKQKDGVLAELRTKLGSQGCLAFLAEENVGFQDAPDKIGVMKTRDQYDILRVRQTSAPNYDMDNAVVIAKLRKWEKQYPFDITGADADWVSIDFKTLPSNLPGFAKDVYKLCPDIVDQGTGTVAALADEIRKTGSLTLWWD